MAIDCFCLLVGHCELGADNDAIKYPEHSREEDRLAIDIFME
jgi:hypothetical protein